MESLAAVLEKLNSPLQLRKLKIPSLQKGQVLVKIAYTGICHTQLNELEGKKGEDKFLPHTLGHEASGTVLEIGEGITKVKPGDHVVLSWLKGKGLDVPSSQYLWNDQIVNSGAISTFMTHAIISENRVIPISKEIPLREAALLGCALPTGMGVIFNTLNVRPGKTIAIFGLGGIGMSAVLGAHLMHASKIIAVDVFEDKLKLAKELGADVTINAALCDPLSTILDLTEGQGVDYALEAAGQKKVMEAAFKSVKNKTGVCAIAGNLKHDERIEINPFDLILGKKIIGTWGGESNIDQDVAFYSSLIHKNKINLSPLISEEFELKDIMNAIDKLKSGKIIRGLIKID